MTSGLDREQALLDVIASIMSRSTLTDLFRDLTQKLSRFVPFDRMVLLLYDEARREFVSAESYAAFPPDLPLGYISPRDQTPAGEVILSQKRFHIADVSGGKRGIRSYRACFANSRLAPSGYLPLTTPSRRIGAPRARHGERDSVLGCRTIVPGGSPEAGRDQRWKIS